MKSLEMRRKNFLDELKSETKYDGRQTYKNDPNLSDGLVSLTTTISNDQNQEKEQSIEGKLALLEKFGLKEEIFPLFTEQEAGKATINTPTILKDSEEEDLEKAIKMAEELERMAEEL